jgi:uncharacterized protein YjbI with pentapeptide repeats
MSDNEEAMYVLLGRGDIDLFNRWRAEGRHCDLRGSDLTGLDLRGLDAAGLDLRDCHLKHCDLRGLDLSRTQLEGASIFGAKIAETLFPTEISADEITLSLTHGTRLRYRC